MLITYWWKGHPPSFLTVQSNAFHPSTALSYSSNSNPFLFAVILLLSFTDITGFCSWKMAICSHRLLTRSHCTWQVTIAHRYCVNIGNSRSVDSISASFLPKFDCKTLHHVSPDSYNPSSFKRYSIFHEENITLFQSFSQVLLCFGYQFLGLVFFFFSP